MDELKLLIGAFSDLGIPVKHIKTEMSPRYATYHFNVGRIGYLDGLERKVKFMSAYIHKDIQYSNSKIAHFALRLPTENDRVFEANSDSFMDALYEDEKDGDLWLGVDDYGKNVIINLNDTPHMLISGITGSGKSMLLHSIMCSLMELFDTSYFILIDTKRIELGIYKECKDIKICKDSDFATILLKASCELMEERYKEMEEKHLRKKPNNMQDIIIIIDEFADLIMHDKSVENYVVRIAQLGRGCGIHLIIATQHPVVSVLTGRIKANIGCRISLKTASAIDSVSILGHKGAEQLKGKGDALLKLPTMSEEIHIQCPYISEETINEISGEYYEKFNTR